MLNQQQRPSGIDDRLLRADVLRVRPVRNQTANAGSSKTSTCILGDGSGRFTAYHKPAAGIDRQQAHAYGHDPLSALINESVARLLAGILGAPYSEMVPALMIRSIHPTEPGTEGGYGTMTEEAPGKTLQDEPKQQQALCDPAAFFDALIAQQDRHDANFRWEPGRLGLLDNAYAFAAPDPKYKQWDSVFVQARHDGGRAALTAKELRLLHGLQAHQDLWDFVGRVLRGDQANALRDRVNRMIASGRLLNPLEF